MRSAFEAAPNSLKLFPRPLPTKYQTAKSYPVFTVLCDAIQMGPDLSVVIKMATQGKKKAAYLLDMQLSERLGGTVVVRLGRPSFWRLP